MTKLNNSFIDTRNNTLLLLIASLMTFLTITFLVIPLTANAEENTSINNDETNHLSTENEPSVHNYQEQLDNDESKNETTSTEDESQDVTEQQEDKDSTDADENLDVEDEDNVESEIDKEDNTTDQDESDREDVNNNDENENDSESANEDLDIENSEDIDTDLEEEVENTPESEKEDEEDVEADEEDEVEDEAEKSEEEEKEKPKVAAAAAVSTSKSNELKKGDQNKQVVQMKNDLSRLGFGKFPNKPSQTYGKVTANVVKEFQKHYKLSQTGNLDSKTLKKLKEVLNPPYKKGDRGQDIVNLKNDLSIIGFGNFPKNPSINYGTVTANVVKEFQKAYSLSTSGIANQTTLNKIKQVLQSYKNGSKGEHVKIMKKNLSDLGFGNFPKNPSTSYGKVTEGVVKDFQKFFDLKADGIASKDMLTVIFEIKKGDFSNGKHITGLKKNLTKAGFGSFPKNPSQTYGNVTKKVVKEFQSYFGVTSTGNPSNTTIKSLTDVIYSSYQSGNKNTSIRNLKIDLTSLGFGNFPKNPSTSYGAVTEGVVIDFQKSNKLAVSGIADKVTLNKLKQLVKEKNDAKKVIYLDAGHGGSDPGAIANGLREKDITLDLAKRVQKKLEADGYKVIMTRTTDTFLQLKERSQKANKANADIFVSIHVNSGGGTGIETWWNDNNEKAVESLKLASEIQNEVIKATNENDRGVKGRTPNLGDFHVTRVPKMASALIEVGFIDKKEDAEKLKLSSFKNKVAKGIVAGIKKYFNII